MAHLLGTPQGHRSEAQLADVDSKLRLIQVRGWWWG